MDRQRRKQRRTCRHSARACDLCPCLPLPLVPDGNSHMGAVMLRETDVGEPRNMLVLGGARSGKSRYAQQCAETFAGELVFVATRLEEHTSELQSLMRISYAVFCLKKKKTQ